MELRDASDQSCDPLLSIKAISEGPCDSCEANERQIFVLRSGMIRSADSQERADAPCVLTAPNEYQFVASNNASGSHVRFVPRIAEGLVHALTLSRIFYRLLGSGTTQVFAVEMGQVLSAEALIREIEAELDAHQAGFEAMVISKLAEILVTLYRSVSDQPAQAERPPSRDVWSIHRVIRYVQESYNDPFSLVDIANRCALNTTTFSREFKRIAGSPLFEYVNKIRIQKACLLLKRSRRPVIDIAMDVGYNNISFFNRYFKKTMGMSPTTYRAAVRR